MNAAKIAGYDCLRIINDNTASALNYAVDKKLGITGKRIVCFVNMGQCYVSFTVVVFEASTVNIIF